MDALAPDRTSVNLLQMARIAFGARGMRMAPAYLLGAQGGCGLHQSQRTAQWSPAPSRVPYHASAPASQQQTWGAVQEAGELSTSRVTWSH